MRRPLLVFGTRPEAIKMAPVVRECRRLAGVGPVVCVTAQHRQMLDPVIDYFDIEVDEDLELMGHDQGLADLTARCLRGVDSVLERRKPDCVVAQGDTTTVLATALASFYRRVPFVHVEAGLRTGDLDAPWPEEMDRRVASLVASLHCAPTKKAADNLLREGIRPDRVHVTGNTVIDALNWTSERERARAEHWEKKYPMLGDRRMVLITGHRRENFGQGFRDICQAITELGRLFPDVAFLYPVHLNPNVQGPVNQALSGLLNVYLTAPAPYPEFVWLMGRSTLILTDSGGVQEEAPSLRKPVLVMRETTERPEAVEAGAVELVGTSPESIVDRVSLLLTDEAEHARRQVDHNPYGDGRAAERIARLIAAGAWE
jgi:UDP-N-acetylglucosamine 2-epimerase (non-hydrolysing)